MDCRWKHDDACFRLKDGKGLPLELEAEPLHQP